MSHACEVVARRQSRLGETGQRGRVDFRPEGGVIAVSRSGYDEARSPEAKSVRESLTDIEKHVDQVVERILETTVPWIVRALETFEKDKLLLQERIAAGAVPVRDFNERGRTAPAFLANPCNLWKSGRIEDRRTVLKRTFANPPRYKRGEGFRAADRALPFKVFGNFNG